MLVLALVLPLIVSSTGRDIKDICAKFGLKSVDKNEKNVVCYNSTSRTVTSVRSLNDYHFLLYPTSVSDGIDATKLCSYSREKSWTCQSVIFTVPKTEEKRVFSPALEHNRVKRQADTLDLIEPRVAKRNVTFSVLTVAGTEWVCEQLSETQCKPLYPKGEPRAQYLTDVRLDSLTQIIEDDTRWKSIQARKAGGGGGISSEEEEEEEVLRAFQEDPGRTEGDENSTEQSVYNINGITWWCRQQDQLKCIPILNPWDGSRHPPGLEAPSPSTASRPQPRILRPSSNTGGRRLEENSWEYENIGQTTARPPFKRTTFCSRAIKFIAKDEVLLNFNSFSGQMKMYIKAVRGRGGLEVTARMLRPGQEGLGAAENSPPVTISADVNCDTITLTVEDKQYKLDYGFGRLGVKDLEVLGNLESTGMVPRGRTERPQLGTVRNFVEAEDFSPLLLRASPVPSNIADTLDNNVDNRQEEEEDFPVTDDNYQIDGLGDVEVSLGESSNTQRRYQISRDQDGEVNIDVVVGDQIRAPARSVVIDNKDYNYTLIISGENIQVIQHDTKRNLTYKHGLDESQISEVGVSGDLRGATTSFRETDRQRRPTVAPPSRQTPVQRPRKIVSVFGNLCLAQCSPASDGRHYCEVGGGGSEECGPGSAVTGTTPGGEECAEHCSKRGDEYFWCQRQQAPWDYCSPPLVFQQELRCPEDSERATVPDPSECARYLSCEAGRVRLEECAEGLHYIHRNRTCEFPTGGGCGEVFGRSDSGRTTNKRLRFPTEYPDIQPRVKTGGRSRLTPSLTLNSPNSLNSPAETDHSFPRSLSSPGQADPNYFAVAQVQVTTPLTTSTTTTTTTTEQPEVDIEEIIERSRDFKFGLTSHGELCTDRCEQRGYPYYWCHKTSSSLGQWWDSDFCSLQSNTTHYGRQCSEECEQRGEKYFWCRRNDGGWGYCSPSTVYRKGECEDPSNNNKLYAIVGDCQRYIQCRGGRPALSTCKTQLYFDYILLSCTLKKDARCIQD